MIFLKTDEEIARMRKDGRIVAGTIDRVVAAVAPRRTRVARQPAESYVAPLADAEVDSIVELVKTRTGLHAVAYYGSTSY